MEKTVIEKLSFELLDGEFSAWEAEKLIVNLLDQKINFHKLRNLSCQEGHGKPDAHSIERIKELQESKQSFLAVIKRAKTQRLSLSMNAVVSIELL
jgi:hypothetical protein